MKEMKDLKENSKLYILFKNELASVSCYEILKEAFSEKACHQFLSKYAALDFQSSIYFKLRTELDNERYERLSNNQLS
jgi:hypothetical protein